MPENVFDAFQTSARRRGISTRLLESNRTLIAEFEDAEFLKPLCGTHRIQRIPKGENRRHTSTATVALVDEIESDFVLNEADLRERFTRGSGNGGQNRNVHDNCVIMTHVPTGVEVRIDGRSQWQNRQEARRVLSKRIAEYEIEKALRICNADRQTQVNPERSAKSFTHNTQRDEVVDHDTGQKWRLSSFMKGKI